MYAEHNHWVLGNNYQIYYYYTYTFELYSDTSSCHKSCQLATYHHWKKGVQMLQEKDRYLLNQRDNG